MYKRQVIDQLNKNIKKVLELPATISKLEQSGTEPKWSTPEELAALLKADTLKWAKLIKAKNIKVNE